MTSVLNIVGTDDTPVWMVAKNLETGKYEPTLVAWYSIEGADGTASVGNAIISGTVQL